MCIHSTVWERGNQAMHATSTISQALRHSLHAFAATAIGQAAAKNPTPIATWAMHLAGIS